MKKGILLGIFGLLTSVVSFAGRGHDGDVDGTIQCAEVNKEAIKAFALTGPFREYREEFERSSSPPEWDIQLDPETVPVESPRCEFYTNLIIPKVVSCTTFIKVGKELGGIYQDDGDETRCIPLNVN